MNNIPVGDRDHENDDDDYYCNNNVLYTFAVTNKNKQ